MKKQIRTEIVINAPAEKVWSVLTDFDSFGEWNPFVTSVVGKPKEGEKVKIDVQIPDAQAQKFTPTILKAEPNRELRWVGKMPLGIFRGEHFYMIEELGEGRVKFIHGEDFSGWMVRLIWAIQGEKIQKGYRLMNEAIKKRVEAL